MDDKIYTRNRLRLSILSNKNKDEINRNNGNQKRKENKINKKNNLDIIKLLKFISIILIALIFAYTIMKSIHPIMEKQCRNMAKSVATKISNVEAGKVMKNYTNEDILQITKDEKGNTKMIGTNIIKLNEMISDISVRIQEGLEDIKNNTFNIRLGSFLGSRLFSGMGPNVKIRMEVIGNIDTELKSEFISSGINQTLHKIYLEVRCNIAVLTPYETIDEKIVNQILLAEEVIVGDVPSSYFEVKDK